MSDFLLDLGQNPRARALIKSAGLPIPMPEKLRRARGAYDERPLFDRRVLVSGDGQLADLIADTITRAGANPTVVGHDEVGIPFRGPGEAFGRPATVVPVGPAPDGARIDASRDPQLHELLEGAALCNDAGLGEQDGEWQVHGDPTEGALFENAVADAPWTTPSMASVMTGRGISNATGAWVLVARVPTLRSILPRTNSTA